MSYDGKVSITDRISIAGDYSEQIPCAWARLDQNADATINILDLSMAAGHHNPGSGRLSLTQRVLGTVRTVQVAASAAASDLAWKD